MRIIIDEFYRNDVSLKSMEVWMINSTNEYKLLACDSHVTLTSHDSGVKFVVATVKH